MNMVIVCVTADPDIEQTDPRWIGAWWIGFVICALCTIVWALPMAMFPLRLAGPDCQTEQQKKAASDSANNDLMSNLTGAQEK